MKKFAKLITELWEPNKTKKKKRQREQGKNQMLGGSLLL
jgi:hypothetical protein